MKLICLLSIASNVHLQPFITGAYEVSRIGQRVARIASTKGEYAVNYGSDPLTILGQNPTAIYLDRRLLMFPEFVAECHLLLLRSGKRRLHLIGGDG